MLPNTILVSEPPAVCGPGTHIPSANVGRVIGVVLQSFPLSFTCSCTPSPVFIFNHSQHLMTRNSRGYLQLDGYNLLVFASNVSPAPQIGRDSEEHVVSKASPCTPVKALDNLHL